MGLSMPISFHCSLCTHLLRVADTAGGKRVRCPSCGARTLVPHQSTVAGVPGSDDDKTPAPDAVADSHESPKQPSKNTPSVVSQTAVSTPAVVQPRRVNPLGVAAFIFGVLALLICWIPLIGVFSIIFALMGVLLGFTGLILGWTSRRFDTIWAWTGVALSIFAFLVSCVMVAATLQGLMATLPTGSHVRRDLGAGVPQLGVDSLHLDAAEITDWNWQKDPDFGTDGTIKWNVQVRNKSSANIESIKVDFITYDKEGKLVASSFTYLHAIPPGEARTRKSYADLYMTEARAVVQISEVRLARSEMGTTPTVPVMPHRAGPAPVPTAQPAERPRSQPPPPVAAQPAERPRSQPPPPVSSGNGNVQSYYRRPPGTYTDPVPTSAQLEAEERKRIHREFDEAERKQAAEKAAEAQKNAEEAKRDEKRAATLLRNAQNLEDVNRQGAASLYYQIINDFPETPQAKTASERVRALELRPH
jgi:hypothetical protein